MRWLSEFLHRLRRIAKRGGSTAHDAPLFVSDDPFESSLSALAALDEQQRAALPIWAKDVLSFGRFMSHVAADGVLVALSNNWTDREELMGALRRIGEADIAQLLADATEIAVSHGKADGLRCDAELALDDEVVSEAFSEAENAMEDRWDEMWAGAQRYAAEHGWSPGTASAL